MQRTLIHPHVFLVPTVSVNLMGRAESGRFNEIPVPLCAEVDEKFGAKK
jgi:hypothetical protein